MRNRAFISVLGICFFVFAAACSSPPSSPSETVKKVFTANGDEIVKLLSRRLRSNLSESELEQFKKQADEQRSSPKAKIKILKEEVTGDHAEVTGRVTEHIAGTDTHSVVKYGLVKEDSEWKIELLPVAVE